MEKYKWIKEFQIFSSNYFEEIIFAFTILIAGTFSAFLIRKISFHLLKRKTKSEENFLLKFFNADQLYSITNIVSRLLFWATIVVSLTLTLAPFGLNPLSNLGKELLSYLPQIFGSLLILFFGIILANAIKHFLNNIKSEKFYFIPKKNSQLVSSIIMLITLIIATKQIGVDIEFLTSFLLVFLACLLLAGTLSFGIGSSSVVANILATYYLKKVIKIGSNIEGLGYSGRVIEINSTNVLIQAKDGIDVFPSKTLMTTSFRIKNVHNL